MRRRKFQGNFATRVTRRSQSRTVAERRFMGQANSPVHAQKQRGQTQTRDKKECEHEQASVRYQNGPPPAMERYSTA